MRWTAQQVARFNEDGYLFLPALFSPEEIAVLNAELPGILAQQRPENLREQNIGAVRSALSPHLYNEAFRRLSRHPRLIDPAMQVLGGEVYLHQFKINPQKAVSCCTCAPTAPWSRARPSPWRTPIAW